MDAQLATAYKWPGRTAFTFSLNERTEEGKPTLRAYARIEVIHKNKSHVRMVLIDRAVTAVQESVDRFVQSHPDQALVNDKYNQFELTLSDKDWTDLWNEIAALLNSVLAGWKSKMKASEAKSTETPEM